MQRKVVKAKRNKNPPSKKTPQQNNNQEIEKNNDKIYNLLEESNKMNKNTPYFDIIQLGNVEE